MNKKETYDKIISYGERPFFADQTLLQLKVDPRLPMSWGAAKFIRIPDKQYKNESVGLVFNVSGFLFKGLVLITLAWDDTYSVRFFEKTPTSDTTERTDLEEHNVYCDELASRIDFVVETKTEKA